MTRIEAGGLTMAKDWCDVHDIINAVLGGLSEELSRHTVRVIIADDVPLVKLRRHHYRTGSFQYRAQCRAIYARRKRRSISDPFLTAGALGVCH